MRKALTICILAISITLMVNVKAYAEDEPSATPTPTAMPNPYSKLIVRSDGSININNVYDAYFNLLTSDQQDLCNYLIGLSNYMYLTARGFSYDSVSTGQELISMLCTFGYRFWQIVPDSFSSRLTTYMQNYIAACVTYAAQQDDINGNLGAWIDNHREDLYMPYSDNALSGWSAFYNDPTNLGVSSWGEYNSPWVSGTFYEFGFQNPVWRSDEHLTRYNNFILNDSPVLFSNTYNDGALRQYVFSLKDNPVIDSLYLLRSNSNSYNQYRFGNTEGLVDAFTHNLVQLYVSSTGKLNCLTGTYSYTNSITSLNVNYTLEGIINYAFNYGPFVQNGYLSFYYPYVEHVYMVDDLNTLSNKQEIFNVEGLNINDDNAKWIQTPKGEVLYFPLGTGATLVEFPLPEYLKKDDGNGNLVSIDPTKDLTQEIVNNTVINNFDIVAPGVVINVPVDWFDSEGNYLDYTYNYSLPFFAFVGDVFLSLGEIRIFLLAGVILLICGGVIGKFLL